VLLQTPQGEFQNCGTESVGFFLYFDMLKVNVSDAEKQILNFKVRSIITIEIEIPRTENRIIVNLFKDIDYHV
jgi:transcription-repair coupling factor (superfamily II helicase)